jgi:hypothetical protein
VKGYSDFRPGFAAALDPRLHDIAFLDAMVAAGRAQYWEGEAAALVTELRSFPTGAAAVCALVAAGDPSEVADRLRPRAEAWGHAAGCGFAIVESRPGWQRLLEPHGYAPFQLSLIKPL